VPVQRIVEVPVENKIFVDKEYEKIVEKPYEVIRENVIINDHIIDVDINDIGNYKDAQVMEEIVEY